MNEKQFKIIQDIYGDYTIFDKYDLLYISDIEDKKLAEVICEKFESLYNQYYHQVKVNQKLRSINEKLEKDIEYYMETYKDFEYGLNTLPYVQLAPPASRKYLFNENKKLRELLKHSCVTTICENCKHSHFYRYFDPATYKYEYNMDCLRELHPNEEVHECEGFKLKELKDLAKDLRIDLDNL